MRKVFAIAAVALSVACTSEPTIQTGPNAETTFDGLVRIDNARFAAAWIDPDIDLTQYDKILPGGAEFQFRHVQKTAGRMTATRANEREFWISDSQKQRLVDPVPTRWWSSVSCTISCRAFRPNSPLAVKSTCRPWERGPW